MGSQLSPLGVNFVRVASALPSTRSLPSRSSLTVTATVGSSGDSLGIEWLTTLLTVESVSTTFVV